MGDLMSEFKAGYILVENERITIWGENCSNIPPEAKKYYDIGFNVQQGIQFLCYTEKVKEDRTIKERLIKKMWKASSHFYTTENSLVMLDLESSEYQIPKRVFPNVSVKKEQDFENEVKKVNILNTEKNKYEYFYVIEKDERHYISIDDGGDIEIIEKITIPPKIQIKIIEEKKIK